MAAPSSDGRSPPWADLPVEIIGTVVKHLDMFSAVRLAAVCRPWERAVRTDRTLSFGKPCLLMTREYEDNGYYDNYEEEEDKFELLNLTREPEREEAIPLQALIWGLQEQRWVGGKDDWLATVDDCGNARLVNPYTGCQIDLPDISNVVFPTGAAKTRDTFQRIIMCDTPYDSTGTGYLVIAVVYEGILAIARGGDNTWTVLRNPYRCFYCSDAVVHKGKVFAVDSSGCLYAWDIGDASFPEATPELTDRPNVDDLLDDFQCRWWLAESADGRRLLLVCIYGKEIDCEKTTGYRRHRFTYRAYHAEGLRLYQRDVNAATGDGDNGWSAVVSLGDNSLFLGPNYPFIAPIDKRDSSGSSYYHQLRPNCVCVTNNQLLSSQCSECDKNMFDLGAEGHLYDSSNLYSDRFNFRFQTPMWFRPILRNYDIE